jgi:hypothetical protein
VDERAIRLTERDHGILAFAAEHRLVLERQLQRLAGTGVSARTRALVQAGYLKWGCVFGEPHYQIRPSGLAAIDSSLPAPRFKLTAYKHDVGLAWLWLAAQRGTFGRLRQVLGERRLRSADGVSERPLEPCAVRLGGLDRYGKERLHYPDLLLIDRQDRRLALELELTPKGRERRELILGGYGTDERIDRVLYLVEDDLRGRRIGRLVESSAHEMGIADLVRIQLIKPLRVTAQAPKAIRPRTRPSVRSQGADQTR